MYLTHFFGENMFQKMGGEFNKNGVANENRTHTDNPYAPQTYASTSSAMTTQVKERYHPF